MTAFFNTESFYGTTTETYYVDSAARAWLLQSPEMGDVAAVSASHVPDDAGELNPSLIDSSLHSLAQLLDLTELSGAVIWRDLDSESTSRWWRQVDIMVDDGDQTSQEDPFAGLGLVVKCKCAK